MPIIDLQRRIAEAGRIRIGAQTEASNGRTRPVKLETFRLTSPDKRRIEQAAALWGGTPQPWQAPAGPQWEVFTEQSALDVIVPPMDMSFSQSYELWSAGGCQRRCDGRWNTVAEGDCICDPDNRECDIHTRLSVMLCDLPGLGVWRVDTQGYYAAVELQGAVQVIEMAAGRGQLLPARLLLVQRQVKRQGPDGKPQTRKFAVPVLDIEVTPGQLLSAPREIRLSLPSGATELTVRPQPAIDGSAALDTGPDFPPGQNLTPVPASVQHRPAGTVREQMQASTEPQERKRRRNSAQPVPATGVEPRTAAQAQADIERDVFVGVVTGDAGPIRQHLPGPTSDPDEKAGLEAAADFVNELAEVVEHRGRHEGHTLEKVGPCVYCSCGFRYQGDLPKPEPKPPAGLTTPGSVTSQQIRVLFAALTRHGFNAQKEPDTLLQIIEVLAGRELTGPNKAVSGNPRTTKNLSQYEADKVVKALDGCDSQAAVWELVQQLQPVELPFQDDPQPM